MNRPKWLDVLLIIGAVSCLLALTVGMAFGVAELLSMVFK